MKCLKTSSMVAILALALVLTMGEAVYSSYGDDDNPTLKTTTSTTITIGSSSPNIMATLMAPAPAPIVSPPKVKKPPHKPHPLHSHKPHSHRPPHYGPPRKFGAKSGKGTYQYWQSNPSNIPNVFMTEMATIDRIFGSSSLPKYGNKLTVMDALANNDSNMQNGYTNLAQQAIASLLNAYTVVNFVYTPEQVHELFNDALVSPDTASKQALEFEHANLLV